MKLLGLCFVIVILKFSVSIDLLQPDEQILHSFIKSKNVSNLTRPTGNNSGTLTVKLGMRLSQLLDVVSIHNLTDTIQGFQQRPYCGGRVLLKRKKVSTPKYGNYITNSTISKGDDTKTS